MYINDANPSFEGDLPTFRPDFLDLVNPVATKTLSGITRQSSVDEEDEDPKGINRSLVDNTDFLFGNCALDQSVQFLTELDKEFGGSLEDSFNDSDDSSDYLEEFFQQLDLQVRDPFLSSGTKLSLGLGLDSFSTLSKVGKVANKEMNSFKLDYIYELVPRSGSKRALERDGMKVGPPFKYYR